MVKQLRIDFPDYPAEEQERDAERHKQLKEREIYVMKVDGAWGGYMPRPKCSLTFNAERGIEIGDFIKNLTTELEELNIKPRYRCVENYGIAEHIRQHQFIIKGKNNGRC